MFISWEITGPRKNGKGRDGETCKGFRLQREDVGSAVWRNIPMAPGLQPCTRRGSLPQFPHPNLPLPCGALKMHWKPRSPPRVEGGMGRERTQVKNHLNTAQGCSKELPAAGHGLTLGCAQLGAVSCGERVVFSWLDVDLVCKTSCWRCPRPCCSAPQRVSVPPCAVRSPEIPSERFDGAHALGLRDARGSTAHVCK